MKASTVVAVLGVLGLLAAVASWVAFGMGTRDAFLVRHATEYRRTTFTAVRVEFRTHQGQGSPSRVSKSWSAEGVVDGRQETVDLKPWLPNIGGQAELEILVKPGRAFDILYNARTDQPELRIIPFEPDLASRRQQALKQKLAWGYGPLGAIEALLLLTAAVVNRRGVWLGAAAVLCAAIGLALIPVVVWLLMEAPRGLV